MIALICSGGPSTLLCSLERFLNRRDVIFIGADQGAQTLYEQGIIPDVMIGDFDSIQSDALQKLESIVPRIIRANVEKDETDTDLALQYALTMHPTEIILTCVSGGRLDHEEAAKRSLLRVQLDNPTISCKILSKRNSIQYFTQPNRTYTFESDYKYVSFFAVNESIKGVTIKHVKYETNLAPLPFTSSRFTSNELVAAQGELYFTNGICMMMTSVDE
jgi:thiamine pyrophosphokinase